MPTGRPQSLNVTDSGTDTTHFVFNKVGQGTGVVERHVRQGRHLRDTANDILTGGAGADQFVFAPEPGRQRHHHRFQPGEDHIDLRLFSEIDSANIDDWLQTHAAQSPANPPTS